MKLNRSFLLLASVLACASLRVQATEAAPPTPIFPIPPPVPPAPAAASTTPVAPPAPLLPEAPPAQAAAKPEVKKRERRTRTDKPDTEPETPPEDEASAAPRKRKPVVDLPPKEVRLPDSPGELLRKLIQHYEYRTHIEPRLQRARNALHHLREALPHVQELAE